MEVVGGRYRIIKKIAKGGFGTTYLAEHVELPGSLVCIKHASRISPESETILQREAQAMWDLRHHAIPAVRDFFHLDDGSVALVMGYIDGSTLHDLVEANGPMEPETVCWIAERMLNALKYLHYHGIINGDVKPKNTLIKPETHGVALVDFGISAIRPGPDDVSFGYTPIFGAPESNPKFGMPLLPESDFYSLGATMVFALTGDIEAVRNRRIPASVPRQMAEFMRRLVHLEPLDRPSWKDEDLVETLGQVRFDSFGRRWSGLHEIEYTRTQSS